MAGKNTELQEYIASEIAKYKDVAVPVPSSLFVRLIRKQLPLSKLHPNPDDEFCFPDIGPNEGIISNYVQTYSRFENDEQGARIAGAGNIEPIIVQKIRPDGYMILNGHHRWAAVHRLGWNKIRVQIVNLTLQEDVKRILARVRNEKRVTLDLDEVVFAQDTEPAEKPLPLLWRKLYPQRVRLGIPAVFYYLSQHGYDIWVYTARYDSEDVIRRLLLHHHAPVTGVITGTGRKAGKGGDVKNSFENMVSGKYSVTVHVDQSSVLRVDNTAKNYEEFRLPGAAGWSQEVLEIFRKLDHHE